MDSLVFSEFCEHYTEMLRREQKKDLGLHNILPMSPLLEAPDNRRSPSREDNFLTLANEGNYLKSREADV